MMERCPEHTLRPSRHACAACADAFEAARDAIADREAREYRQRIEARRQLTLAAAACTMCDDAGRMPSGRLCLHRPDQEDTNRRGLAACREAMACHA